MKDFKQVVEWFVIIKKWALHSKQTQLEANATRRYLEKKKKVFVIIAQATEYTSDFPNKESLFEDNHATLQGTELFEYMIKCIF